MLRTELICIALTEGKVSDENLASALNEQITALTAKNGNLRAYTLLSDYTNRVGSRFVKFVATFRPKIIRLAP